MSASPGLISAPDPLRLTEREAFAEPFTGVDKQGDVMADVQRTIEGFILDSLLLGYETRQSRP